MIAALGTSVQPPDGDEARNLRLFFFSFFFTFSLQIVSTGDNPVRKKRRNTLTSLYTDMAQ